ncbi:unnamed protein product [Effrenium voratum]|uniref:Uncharacterized protein n=1 Tax=Effrenium voratum TaxID=2562239 RepID=A0AA36MW23_9DINO|nr:unnamed protein product [Effrenium voratum]
MRRSEAGVLILVGKNPAVVATPGTRLKHAKKPLDWKPQEEKGLVITDDYWDIFQFGPEELQKMDEMVEEKNKAESVPALVELQPDEENDYNNIMTKMVIAWMLLHLAACGPQHYEAHVIDVKDAFLMVPQPEEERASVTHKGKLVRCLPASEQLQTGGMSILGTQLKSEHQSWPHFHGQHG